MLNRRAFLSVAAAGLGVLAGCTSTGPPRGALILPVDERVAEVEQRRRTTGQVRRYPITARVSQVDLGGEQVTTWTYDGRLPGQEIRVRAGDVVEVPLTNLLPHDMSIHWHGVALRNDMDGVPGLTQAPVASHGTFVYRFVAETPGTFWFHPHAGLHLDHGLYAPLIVEDPAEPGDYDHDWTIVLDDWLDGSGSTPEDVYDRLRNRGSGMHSMRHRGSGPMGARSPLLGGDVRYPHYLINGRLPAAPATFAARPGQRARIRLVNAGGDTAFRVALGGHTMTVTHTDGFPVQPVETETVLIGMGERYDVLVTLDDGAFPLVAVAEGKGATARAVVRTGAWDAPPPRTQPPQLRGRLIDYDSLRPAEQAVQPDRPVDIEHDIDLTGGMMTYDWGINGRRFTLDDEPLPVWPGQRVQLAVTNTTMMWHPVHLHGHSFQVNRTGPRKDTVMVRPHERVTCDFDADNPGQWMLHCHNIYHAEAGMAAVLGYRS